MGSGYFPLARMSRHLSGEKGTKEPQLACSELEQEFWDKLRVSGNIPWVTRTRVRTENAKIPYLKPGQ